MLTTLTHYTERFFGVDMSYFMRGSFWLGVGQMTTMASAFFLSILYARYLPKAVYGDYRYVLSVLSIAGIFALPGVATSITRSVARGYDGTFRKGGRVIFFSSFGISLVGLAISMYLFTHGKQSLAWGFVVASLITPGVEGLGNWRSYYDGKKAFRAKTLLNIIDQSFYFISMIIALAIIFLFHTKASTALIILLTGYSIGEGLPNIYFFIKTLQKVPKNTVTEPGALRYGLHLSLLNIPATVANYIDAVLIHAFIGPSALAIYAFAIALPEQMKSFLGTIADVAFPRLSAHPALDVLKNTLLKKTLRATLITSIITVLYIVLAPVIYKTFFPRYIESIHLSQVFALSLILFPFGIYNTALKADGNIKKIYIYNIIAPIIQIIALLVLIPPFGIWGAIYGRIIGKISNNMLPFFIFQR